MPTTTSSSRSALVIGGGLAGIAAAVRLAEHGVRVTLVETRKRLGGRATSFVDPASGELLDNCQHVMMRCCTNLLDLYQRLGVAGSIQWHRTLYFHGKDVRTGEPVIDALEADDLPAPLHMTRGILAFRTLTWAEKIAISRAMLAIMRMGKVGRERYHDISFARWLELQDQPAGAIEKYWALVAISAINETPERMAADAAIQVFQEGFLCHEDAYVMGLPGVPLVELYDAAERVIAEAGGRVMLSTSAERLVFEAGRVAGLRVDNDARLEADAYVSAVPFDRLAKLATPEMVSIDARLQDLDKFQVSPIIGIHLWLDNAGLPVTDLPHLALMNSPVQWLFNKGMEQLKELGSSQRPLHHLHAVISAAHDLVDQPAERISAMAFDEIRKALSPGARLAKLAHSKVVKEKRATFSAAPGVDAFRPSASGAIANLILAGDWCRSGWPATMEGATRSGYRAAAAALRALSVTPSAAPPASGHDAAARSVDGDDALLTPDLPTAMLYRMISGGA